MPKKRMNFSFDPEVKVLLSKLATAYRTSQSKALARIIVKEATSLKLVATPEEIQAMADEDKS
jgi:hypothetical protein